MDVLGLCKPSGAILLVSVAGALYSLLAGRTAGAAFDVSAYELSARHDIRQLVVSTALTYLELDGLIAHLEGMLDGAGYFFPPDRAHVTRRTLRSVLTKPAWNANEVRTLRGVLTMIERPQKRD